MYFWVLRIESMRRLRVSSFNLAEHVATLISILSIHVVKAAIILSVIITIASDNCLLFTSLLEAAFSPLGLWGWG